MTGRQDILDAFFTLVVAAAPWQRAEQRLRFWTSVPNQPAVFMRYVGDQYPPYEIRGLPPSRMTMSVEIWIYARQQDVDASAMALLAPYIDAVIAGIRPTGAQTAQDLTSIAIPRGLVSHCWVEGRAIYDDGAPANEGQCVAMIPIRIMVTDTLLEVSTDAFLATESGEPITTEGGEEIIV